MIELRPSFTTIGGSDERGSETGAPTGTMAVARGVGRGRDSLEREAHRDCSLRARALLECDRAAVRRAHLARPQPALRAKIRWARNFSANRIRADRVGDTSAPEVECVRRFALRDEIGAGKNRRDARRLYPRWPRFRADAPGKSQAGLHQQHIVRQQQYRHAVVERRIAGHGQRRWIDPGLVSHSARMQTE